MDSETFKERLTAMEQRIESACAKAGRERDAVRLLPVSKTHSPGRIEEAAECGLTVFGENRIQEAQRKIPLCPGHLRWHLIGHLQTNKAKFAAPLFDMVHSVDSIRIMEALDKACANSGKTMPITLEVNVAGEGSKFGMRPEEVNAAVEHANELSRLEPVGLMTLPPFAEDPEKTRRYFGKLRDLRDSAEQATGIPLPELSMGMSHDFEVAIEEGATWIRIGTGLFGKRGSPWKPAL